MSLHRFETQQFISAAPAEIWAFISSPGNLSAITPPYMGFTIVSAPEEDKMYPGMIIAYKVSPVFGLKLSWVTEITHVKEGEFFVDEQRSGPYAFWHHQHHIKPAEGGTLMTDIVHYRVPLGPFGDLMNSLLVRKKLAEIFEFRRMALEKKFTIRVR